MATLDELQSIYDFHDIHYLNEILNLKEESKFLEQTRKPNG